MAKLTEITNFQQHGGGVFQPYENEIEESPISEDTGKIKKVKISDKNKRRKKGRLLYIMFTIKTHFVLLNSNFCKMESISVGLLIVVCNYICSLIALAGHSRAWFYSREKGFNLHFFLFCTNIKSLFISSICQKFPFYCTEKGRQEIILMY